MKRLLICFSLAVCSVLLLSLVAISLLLNTSSGARWLVEKASSVVNEQPGMELSVNDINGSIANTLSLGSIDFRSGDDTVINIKNLELSVSLWALLTNRSLHIQQLVIGSMSVTSPPSDNETAAPPDIESLLQPVFNLPLSIRLDEVSLGELVFNDQLSVSAELADTTLENKGLLLEQLALTVNQHELSLSGFGLQPDLETEGTLNWQTTIAQQSYAGELIFTGHINDLNVTHELSSPLAASSSGQLLSMTSLSPEFSLQHRTVIPSGFMGVPEEVEEIELQLTTSGTPVNIMLTASSSTTVNNVGTVNAELEAAWSAETDEITLSLLELDREGDHLTLNGLLTTDPAFRFEADWQVDTSNDLTLPASMVLNSISGNGTLSLALAEEDEGLPSLVVSASQLTGMLNEYQLFIDGELALTDSTIQRIDLNLSQQSNVLRVSGDRASGEEIDFSLEVPSIDTLLPDLQGELTGSGVLTGSVEEPEITASLSISNFNYPEQALSLEQLNTRFAYAGESNLELEVNASSLTYDALPESIDTIALNMEGSQDNHNISLQLNSAFADFSLSGQGRLMDSDYRMNLEAAQLASIYGDWEIENPVSIEYLDGTFSVPSHCWQYSSLDACFSLNKPAASLPQADFSLSGFPLQWFIRDSENLPLELEEILIHAPGKPKGFRALQRDYQLWLPTNAFMEGLVSVSGHVDPGTDNSLNISASLAPGTLIAGLAHTEENTEDLLATELSRFEISYDQLDFSRVNGDMSTDFSMSIVRDSVDSGLAQGTFTGSVSMNSEQELDGTLEFSFPELAWTESLVPFLESPAGELDGQIQLDGTLDQPGFISDIALNNGSTLLPDYGLNLQNIQVSVNSDSESLIRFSASGESGDGRFGMEGTVLDPFQQSRALEVKLEGEKVEAFNTDDTRIVISPVLSAELSSNALFINGEVNIPTMLLTLNEETAGSSKISVSSDVQVQNAEQDETLRMADDSTTVMRIPMNGTVRVSLGDDVRFSGYGLNMSLEGDVDLEKTPQRPLLANGELTVTEGSYEFYGQKLTAENGNLLFIGNPANPALDVRATRSVDDITVGMQISGTLSDVQGQLFSSPTLPEGEILAMLITGKSLSGVNSQEGNNMLAAIARFGIDKGQGLTGNVQDKLGLDALELNTGRELSDSSVGLGKYLTPDLYMSYKIGLFDNESVLSLDYSLTERLKLEVETGISQSVDLTYTVEK